jgi:type II secretory pathway component PulK
MHERAFGQRGSGLVVALSVLAMLAIMATAFITLMRLDVRITANYVDDQRCEMLARGMLSYFRALLSDDLDRTWGKY